MDDENVENLYKIIKQTINNKANSNSISSLYNINKPGHGTISSGSLNTIDRSSIRYYDNATVDIKSIRDKVVEEIMKQDPKGKEITDLVLNYLRSCLEDILDNPDKIIPSDSKLLERIDQLEKEVKVQKLEILDLKIKIEDLKSEIKNLKDLNI